MFLGNMVNIRDSLHVPSRLKGIETILDRLVEQLSVRVVYTCLPV